MIGLECQPLKMMAALRMRIQLNGESLELPDGETVAGLLVRLDLTGRRVAVERNLDIVPRSQHAETTLTAQAATLDAIFNEMARRAALNMGEYLDATERYMRLALKAQGQCRATLETLAAIKNPPVIFAKQANIAHGPQQVNNDGFPSSTRTRGHARKTDIAPNELL